MSSFPLASTKLIILFGNFRLAISKCWIDTDAAQSTDRRRGSSPGPRRRAASLARVCDFGVDDAEDADGNLSAGPRALCTRRPPPLQPFHTSVPICAARVCMEIDELHGDPTRSTFLGPLLDLCLPSTFIPSRVSCGFNDLHCLCRRVRADRGGHSGGAGAQAPLSISQQ